MKSIRMLVMACACLWAGTASAESLSQAFYRSCIVNASNENAQCRRDSRDGRACHWEYRQEQDRCWNAFINMGKNDPYYGGATAGAVRYEPVPIPQRPVYVLPGMR